MVERLSKKLTRWFNERRKECLEDPNHLQYIQFFPSLSYVSMFVCLSEPIPALLGANDKRGCYKKGPPLKPRHSLSHCICSCLCTWKKIKHALYFYEPCDLFCFVVRLLGMHSINFIETRYLETFAYVWAQHNITF